MYWSGVFNILSGCIRCIGQVYSTYCLGVLDVLVRCIQHIVWVY